VFRPESRFQVSVAMLPPWTKTNVAMIRIHFFVLQYIHGEHADLPDGSIPPAACGELADTDSVYIIARKPDRQ
jgi:hypothetical protein